jgi:hypothetical protein
MDEHFRAARFEHNLPVIMGPCRLVRRPFRRQSVPIVRVTLDGTAVKYDTGPIDWGEPEPTAGIRSTS